MKAKLFNRSYENGLSTQEYCVEGKIHFTKRQFLSDRPYCLGFRPCDASCQQHEYVVPENVAILVAHYTNNNFTGDKFEANGIGEVRNDSHYETWGKRIFEGDYPRWPEDWELVE